ncbi:MAG: hypothetical protein KDD42_00920 [Bdellovibrionales bacterium]|nr:hypothetical protein [Bdellovibrionales bacterium]
MRNYLRRTKWAQDRHRRRQFQRDLKIRELQRSYQRQIASEQKRYRKLQSLAVEAHQAGLLERRDKLALAAGRLRKNIQELEDRRIYFESLQLMVEQAQSGAHFAELIRTTACSIMDSVNSIDAAEVQRNMHESLFLQEYMELAVESMTDMLDNQLENESSAENSPVDDELRLILSQVETNSDSNLDNDIDQMLRELTSR